METNISILEYWFPNESNKIPTFWFSKSKETDEYIILHFNEILKLAENHKLNDMKSTVKGHLELIIILDQFSRHIYRDTSEQYKNDILAFQYAQEFLLENKDTDLTILEKMMVLMPYRHQENIEAYIFLNKYLEKETDPLWNNFKWHTQKNYEYLIKHDKLPRDIPNDKIKIINSEYFASILENPWKFETQTIHKTILNNILGTFINNKIDSTKNNLIIVSLSGGVDSMVILYILHTMKIHNLTVVAVHLDYHNRQETGFEAEYLFRWCELLHIPLYYKYIHEGSRIRKSKERDEYEEMTKEIRFNLYKKVQEQYVDHNKLGVILGHHKGDLQENVFFNLMKGRTLTDLSVIREESEIFGIKILRPLIYNPKSDIFEYAHKNNIPYFKNTTPEWSNRGKYRNILQPALIDTFGDGALTSLSKISSESDELALIIKTNIIDPYFKTIIVKENEHYLPNIQNQTFTYWKYILHEWCNQNKTNKISHKLLLIIYDKICKIHINIEPLIYMITCSDKLKVKITKEYIIFIT